MTGQTQPLQLVISNKVELHAHYMAFVEGGGLFVPTKQPFQMGMSVQVHVFLKEYNKKIPLQGKVCWINPESLDAEAHTASVRKTGVGVQFQGEQAPKIKALFEKVLGALAETTSPSTVY
jgi:type IV pilus assembly protein PilZ